MNQILATSNPSTKKTKSKRSSGPADIKTVVRVFAIAMLVFGVFMIGTGSYAIYRDNEANNSEITKPVITEALNEDSTAVILTVTHDKAIDRIEYSWNNDEVQTITGNGRKYIEQEIEIPGGTNTLNVKAVDIQGQELSTQREFTAEEIIHLAVSGSKLKITAENETEIAYMTYRWDDEEEQRIDINATTADQEIDIPMGEHNLTVILVDVNNETITKEQKVNVEDKITPIDYLDKYKLNDQYKYYENIGKKAIREGKLAAVTMAGGQGTRLGHNGPKGTYDIGLDSHKSLFELLADNLKAEGKKYDIMIPWFIMTSRENNKETVEFFEKHRCFGYKKDKNLFFFVQGELPMMDTEGKILIGEDGLVKLAADGHGGIYESLVKTNMTKKMRNEYKNFKTKSTFLPHLMRN